MMSAGFVLSGGLPTVAVVRRSCFDTLHSTGASKSSASWTGTRGRTRGSLSSSLSLSLSLRASPNLNHPPAENLVNNNNPHGSRSQTIQRKQEQGVPCLMFSATSKPDSGYLFDLVVEADEEEEDQGGGGGVRINFNREIHIQKIAGHHRVGCSQGFLVTVDPNAEIHATNPLTGASLSLPSTRTLPTMIGVIREPYYRKILHYVYVLSRTHTDERERGTEMTPLPQIRPFFFDDIHLPDDPPRALLLFTPSVGKLSLYYMRYSYYASAVLSPSLDFAAVILDDCPKKLAFARVGHGGQHTSSSSSWTALPCLDYSVHAITFHKGLLHAVDCYGTLAIFDLDNPSAPPYLSPPGTFQACRSKILVDDGDDLLLLERKLMKDDETFTVFKLDKSNFKWVRVTSIGDRALFVGRLGESLSLSTHDFPCLSPNCIYFTDQREPTKEDPYPCKDMGVLNLEDGSVKPLSYPGIDLGVYDWPPPVWLMPAML